MAISLVYLDLDGVLNKFFETMFNFWGLHPEIMDEYNIFNLIRKNGREQKPARSWDFDEKYFWSRLDELFWSWIPKSDDFQIWVDFAEAVSDSVIILSKTVLSPGCADGKVQWIERELPDFNYLIGNVNKSLLARPDVLLIDDCRKNVDDFITAGGKSMLVPRRWN